jgi:hypothetical protein
MAQIIHSNSTRTNFLKINNDELNVANQFEIFSCPRKKKSLGITAAFR